MNKLEQANATLFNAKYVIKKWEVPKMDLSRLRSPLDNTVWCNDQTIPATKFDNPQIPHQITCTRK